MVLVLHHIIPGNYCNNFSRDYSGVELDSVEHNDRINSNQYI